MKNVSIKTGTTTERMECASACATDQTGCSGLIFVYNNLFRQFRSEEAEQQTIVSNLSFLIL